MKIKTIVQLCVWLCITSLLQGCSEPAQKPASTHPFSMQSGDPVSAGNVLTFPEDHGAHPAQGIEWWYVTANLKSDSGQDFGVQWTLFRVSRPELSADPTGPWWDGQFYFAHFAVQTDTQHVAFEKSGRASDVIIQASPFEARLKNWSMQSTEGAFLPLSLHASQEGYRVALNMDNSPRVLHGKQGFSQKTQDGHASMYYSYPFLDVSGELIFDEKVYTVTGRAWLDREWSAAFINPNQAGWDWFSLQAENPQDGGLMAFCIHATGKGYEYCSATSIDADGNTRAFGNEQVELVVIKRIELDDVTYPIAWQLSVDGFEPIEIKAVNSDSRNKLSIPYWEGRVVSSGGYNGIGYGELVGY
ncbi:lipocalin-like domain-containing protein [Pseudoalteromonas luteoviolacea]|uniref:AttH domain-containing protein n=1 Tax=Pseudoalteromonas luteoviolacea S4054 TaxID=1129367 RepID=A0A0F6A5Z3_9GAMM|nr:lipocalin-like domain-containing protein [Pseudoalteromonas luteoviolacea]KKE81585.1 hypothetical protein N479_22065 [Pseudoalteromonas luteoviolacea S4054]KZN78879.1 hypothetical protein N481_00120 [Pseudoalteromonas luteoviolacea S4047-1]